MQYFSDFLDYSLYLQMDLAHYIIHMCMNLHKWIYNRSFTKLSKLLLLSVMYSDISILFYCICKTIHCDKLN